MTGKSSTHHDINSEKLLDYFVEGLNSGKSKSETVEIAFNTAVRDFIAEKLDVYSLSSLAQLIYFEIYDPSEINNSIDSNIASLVADLHELGYYTDKSKEGDDFSKEASGKLIYRTKEYFEMINNK